MTIACIIPTDSEFDSFVNAMRELEYRPIPAKVGRLNCLSYWNGSLLVAQGGLGKVDFAIRTLHVLENAPPLAGVICLGTCGSLSPDLAIGDVVIATETIEHDFNRKLTEGPIPKFDSDPALLSRLHSTDIALPNNASIIFGPIASGDEGIDSSARSRELMNRTGGIAVAWEGAGGAKACAFTNVPYIEIRCVSDLADENAMTDFRQNIPAAMMNLARIVAGFHNPSPPVEPPETN